MTGINMGKVGKARHGSFPGSCEGDRGGNSREPSFYLSEART